MDDDKKMSLISFLENKKAVNYWVGALQLKMEMENGFYGFSKEVIEFCEKQIDLWPEKEKFFCYFFIDDLITMINEGSWEYYETDRKGCGAFRRRNLKVEQSQK